MARCCFVALMIAVVTSARADLFQVNVEATTGPPLEQTVGGSNLVRLLENLADRAGEFAVFQGRDLEASIRYAGVSQALVVSADAAGDEVTLRSPLTGLDRTFRRADGDLDRQIRDFLLQEAPDQYAAFLREINRRSPVAVTDGNPRASTAFQADFAFHRHALHPGWNLAEPGARAPRGMGLRFDFMAGSINTNVADGSYFAGGLTTGLRFTQRVGLTLAMPVQYRQIEDADVFDVGGEIALPIRIFTGRETDYAWQVAPIGLVYGSFSRDMAAGGIMVGGGVASSFSYRFNDLTLTMGNQLTFHQGTRLRVGDYRFDTDLRQQILKNGVKATYNLGRVFYVDGGLTLTSFLQPAAVRNYWSPAAGVGVRLTRSAGVRIGYSADLASGYTGHGGHASLYLGW